MDDVQSATGFPCHFQRATNGVHLGFHWPGVQILPRGRRVVVKKLCGPQADHFVALRVDGDGSVELSGSLHAGPQCLVVGARKILDAAVGHESFETHHAARAQFLQAVNVARDEPAP